MICMHDLLIKYVLIGFVVVVKSVLKFIFWCFQTPLLPLIFFICIILFYC